MKCKRSVNGCPWCLCCYSSSFLCRPTVLKRQRRHQLSPLVTKSREKPAAVTSGQLTVEYEEEDQILRSADLHLAPFHRLFRQFFAALRGFSCSTWRVSRRGSSSCCRPRRERQRRWPKPANVSRRLGLTTTAAAPASRSKRRKWNIQVL